MRKFILIFMLLIFASGLTVLLYPYIQGAVVDNSMEKQAQELLDRFEAESATTPNTAIRPNQSAPSAPVVDQSGSVHEIVQKDYTELWEAMTVYNETIWEQRQSGLCDPWAYEQSSFTLGDYGFEDEAFAVLTIPAIDLKMPVYLGASYDHLAAGAAQLSQTSLPIGGNNTNCVIAGHRGWRGASYFRYITDLRPGDVVYITNPWETLVYTVTETKVIDPNDVEDILIQPGRELLTLLTCHPYASGGKQRYVIYCDRVEESLQS